jgi:trimeric autotransporter adhesin
MGNGLLAWWHRRTASSGVAGVALCAVPVAVSVLIGFGASLSGVAGGLATLTHGPDSTPATSASAKTDSTDPKGSKRAFLALAGKTGSSVGSNSGLGSTTGADRGSPGTGAGTGGSGGGGSGPSTISAPGSSGGSGGGSSGGGSSGPSTISVPDVHLPGTGGVNNTVNGTVGSVGGTVNNTLGGVNNTLGGTVNNTLGGVNNTVNNTLGGVNNTVNGLLGR